MLHLSGSLEQVSDLGTLRDLLFTNHHLVLLVAELADPELFAVLFDQRAGRVEHGFALGTEFGITSCELATFLKAVEADLEDVSIELDRILFAILLILLRHLGLTLRTELCTFILFAVIFVAKIKITVQVIGIHLLA